VLEVEPMYQPLVKIKHSLEYYTILLVGACKNALKQAPSLQNDLEILKITHAWTI
jgi:hypothetical protein